MLQQTDGEGMRLEELYTWDEVFSPREIFVSFLRDSVRLVARGLKTGFFVGVGFGLGFLVGILVAIRLALFML